ncbi:hypothetical protein EJ07DRAFT_167152 [Lizonia empirigonia]|nr:hypothetical protein EJ07DRAFT_167152 [Lizonia empirigonia]
MTPSHTTPLLRPIPLRANPTGPPSPPSPPSPLHPSRSSDFLAQLNARLLRTTPRTDAAPESPHLDTAAARLPRANKSFLSLAGASTLFGIYDDGAASVAETPWGAGAETPGHGTMGWVGGGGGEGAREGGGREARGDRECRADRVVGSGDGSGKTGNGNPKPKKKSHTTLLLKLSSLFAFGVLYGELVAWLHSSRHLARMRVVPRGSSTGVVLLWGCAGVALGSLLPCVDLAWEEKEGEENGREAEAERDGMPLSEQINAVVRSVAAFVGVAFAIRRLPWQSTLQLSLTLSLVNPALWYLLDRSAPGLTASLLVTSLLTSVVYFAAGAGGLGWLGTGGFGTGGLGRFEAEAGLRGSGEGMGAWVGEWEGVAGVVWVGSVLFCSCVCFGSVGRRLAVLEGGR